MPKWQRSALDAIWYSADPLVVRRDWQKDATSERSNTKQFSFLYCLRSSGLILWRLNKRQGYLIFCISIYFTFFTFIVTAVYVMKLQYSVIFSPDIHAVYDMCNYNVLLGEFFKWVLTYAEPNYCGSIMSKKGFCTCRCTQTLLQILSNGFLHMIEELIKRSRLALPIWQQLKI